MSRQLSCSLLGDLAEHSRQLSAPLLSDFTSDQSTFRLKVPQGTPPCDPGNWLNWKECFLLVGLIKAGKQLRRMLSSTGARTGMCCRYEGRTCDPSPQKHSLLGAVIGQL